MKILVTGDAGFIGLQLAQTLSKLGHHVVGTDVREVPVKVGYRHVKADLAQWGQVKDLGNFDIIYHIAGHSAGDLSIEKYEQDINDNILSTAHIIKLAKYSVTKQIIYASSMAVYGDQPEYPVKETATPMPLVYYGANKLTSEYYLKIASSQKLHTTSLRIFNIYGPGQDITNLNQGMVSIFIGEMLKYKHFHMRGKPDRFRDFVYIDDCVNALVLCLDNPRINGEVINLASGVKHTLGELLELIRMRLPFEVSVSYGEPSAWDLNRMHGDTTKAKELLGFEAKVQLEEGIERTMEWVLEHSKIKIYANEILNNNTVIQ